MLLKILMLISEEGHVQPQGRLQLGFHYCVVSEVAPKLGSQGWKSSCYTWKQGRVIEANKKESRAIVSFSVSFFRIVPIFKLW